MGKHFKYHLLLNVTLKSLVNINPQSIQWFNIYEKALNVLINGINTVAIKPIPITTNTTIQTYSKIISVDIGLPIHH